MTQKQLSLVHFYGAHSPSRVVVIRLRLLGSANLRFGLHRLQKQYSIVFASLTRRPPRGMCLPHLDDFVPINDDDSFQQKDHQSVVFFVGSPR